MTDDEDLNNSKEVADVVSKIRALNNMYFDGKRLIANRLAMDIIFDNPDYHNFTGNNCGFIVINSKDSEIYRYSDGVYLDDGDRYIKAIARQILGDMATNQRVSEIVSAVKQMPNLLIEREQLNNYTILINLQNGIYNTETDELLPHNKKYYFTNKMNIIYNKDMKCPNIIKFLLEVHIKDDITIIQELFGYCMYPKYDYHKIFFLIGNGRNGKSTELNILRNFIGKINISSATIQELIENPFSASQLFGKLANISADVGMKSVSDTGILKRLSGGDSIMAQYKFAHHFEFINYAKLIYACNNPPEIKDSSDAMWSRMIHITFPNTFLDNAPGTDPNIIDKLITQDELSGLFNWAMDGLKRLKVNKKFSYNKTVEENRETYERKANPITGFVKDMLIDTEESYIPKDSLYKIYVNWCKKEKIATINSVSFARRLKDAVPGCYSVQLGTGEDRQYVYMNVTLKDENYQLTSSTSIKVEPQQKLDFKESLQDRIQNLLTCIEMNKQGLTFDDLIANGFESDFISNCLKKKIILKLPNGMMGAGK